MVFCFEQVEHMDAASPSGESSNTRKSSDPIKSTPEENQQLAYGHIQSESTPQENSQLGFEQSQSENTPQKICQLGSEHVQSESTPQESHHIVSEHMQSVPVETMMVQGADSADIKLVEPAAKNVAKNCSRSSSKMAKASLGSGKRTYVLRSSVGSARVLRSRSCEASKALVLPVSVNVITERKKKGKKEKPSRKLNDEFSRIRKRLRYLLTRMSYEQSLIDAYSGEGWKGQSSEKIKPEKELQRASTEILRCKQKIRSLFQHIDSSCAEGRLQESLFDSNGQIYSEDIFCSKCGSKDLTTANDIILCDGMCYRGFHQMCLDPPLLKEEIPPGDEGWLCPGCDCKVDCIDLLNDSLGLDLSTGDHWEKVFPEAAATPARYKQDDDLGLPSDDSEDDDYDPDGPQNDGKSQTEDSYFEESDFTSASEDSRALPNDDLYLGLLSDDAEDNDYDPNAPDHDELIKKESSSSDFTSDSEYFSASDPNATLVSGKRKVERLDYKKLHDETYGNVPCDSSDDEDWTEGNASRKGKSNSVGNCTMSPKGNSSTTINVTNKDIKRNSETVFTPERNTRQKLDIEGVNKSVLCKHKDGSEPCSSEKLTTASPSRSLGKVATQRLSESLRENQYPDRSTKEKLVKELGITLRQVSKWFENARRSLRLSANVGVSKAETIPPNKESNLIQFKIMDLEPEPDKDAAKNVGEDRRSSKTGSAEVIGTECCSGNEKRRKSVTEESSQKKSATSKSRKRSQKDNEELDEMNNMEIPEKGKSQTASNDGTPEQEMMQSQIKTRSRKSAA